MLWVTRTICNRNEHNVGRARLADISIGTTPKPTKSENFLQCHPPILSSSRSLTIATSPPSAPHPHILTLALTLPQHSPSVPSRLRWAHVVHDGEHGQRHVPRVRTRGCTHGFKMKKHIQVEQVCITYPLAPPHAAGSTTPTTSRRTGRCTQWPDTTTACTPACRGR